MTAYSVLADRAQAPCATEPFYRFISPDGATWTEFHRRGAEYLLRFPGLADFEVSASGSQVSAHPAPGSDSFTVEHLYVNQVLPLALSRQGRLAFHASAVTVRGGAVAFLGQSGQGKSTLAAQFAGTGAQFLTDDGLLLQESPNGLLVEPNHPSIRLWDDSRLALIDEGASLAPAISFTSKARVLAGKGLSYCHEPQPLLAAYVLELETIHDVTIDRASMVDSVLGWVRNSFLLDVEDPALIKQHFENATGVAVAVPTYYLRYPRRYDYLPDVQAAIVRHITELEGRNGS